MRSVCDKKLFFTNSFFSDRELVNFFITNSFFFRPRVEIFFAPTRFFSDRELMKKYCFHQFVFFRPQVREFVSRLFRPRVREKKLVFSRARLQPPVGESAFANYVLQGLLGPTFRSICVQESGDCLDSCAQLHAGSVGTHKPLRRQPERHEMLISRNNKHHLMFRLNAVTILLQDQTSIPPI